MNLRPDTSRWQIAVKSFRRFDALRRFIGSVHHYYPDARILVADDSFEQPGEPPAAVRHILQLPGVTWHQLPFDVGISAGRKFLFEQATSEYVLLCDDDFVFWTSTTSISSDSSYGPSISCSLLPQLAQTRSGSSSGS
jgi:hypothetical protein